MSVRLAHVHHEGRSFTLLAEQEVPVSVEEFDRAVGRPREMGRWFNIDFSWPTAADHQLEVGSAMEFKAPVGPFSTEFILIVADRVPGQSLLLRTTRGTVDMTLEYGWRPSPTGVSVSMRVDFRVRGAWWWRGPWTRTVARRRLARGMESMSRHLEQTRQDGAAVLPAATAAPGSGVHRTGPTHRAAPRRRRPQRV